MNQLTHIKLDGTTEVRTMTPEEEMYFEQMKMEEYEADMEGEE